MTRYYPLVMRDAMATKPPSKAFLARAIHKAQRLSVEDPFCAAINEYLIRAGVMVWDEERGLFWVNHPTEGYQVAVWMMPVAVGVKPEIEGDGK